MSKQGDIFRAADGTMRRRPPLAGLLPVYSSMAPERPVRERRFQYFSLAGWSRVDKDATADLATCLAERVCRAARCDYCRHLYGHMQILLSTHGAGSHKRFSLHPLQNVRLPRGSPSILFGYVYFVTFGRFE